MLIEALPVHFFLYGFIIGVGNGGHEARHIYTKQVKVGDEWIPNIERMLVGYEQLGTTTEQYIDHYECTCGATK